MSEPPPTAAAAETRLFVTQRQLLDGFRENQHAVMDSIARIVEEFRSHMLAELETDRLRTTDLTARLSQLYEELTLMKSTTDAFAVAMTDQIARDQEQMDLRDRAILAIQHTLQRMSITTVEQQSDIGATQDQVHALEGRVDALTPNESPA